MEDFYIFFLRSFQEASVVGWVHIRIVGVADDIGRQGAQAPCPLGYTGVTPAPGWITCTPPSEYSEVRARQLLLKGVPWGRRAPRAWHSGLEFGGVFVHNGHLDGSDLRKEPMPFAGGRR